MDFYYERLPQQSCAIDCRRTSAHCSSSSTGTNSPVRFANVSRADHHCFAAERHHLRGFGAERYCSRFAPSRFLQKLDQWRVGCSLESGVLTARVNYTLKIRIGLHLLGDRGFEKFEHVLGSLSRYRPP